VVEGLLFSLQFNTECTCVHMCWFSCKPDTIWLVFDVNNYFNNSVIITVTHSGALPLLYKLQEAVNTKSFCALYCTVTFISGICYYY